MFFKSRRFVIARVALILVLLGGMLGTVPVHAVSTTRVLLLPLADETIRVSVDSNGGQANGDSIAQSISADGRYVAFSSDATNLVPDMTSGMQNVYVYDIQTGLTTLASIASNGMFGNSSSQYPSISGDGRYVAFHSYATNLVPSDTNAASDIFVHDLQTGTTTLVSVDSSGVQTNGLSHDASISADGRFIAFTSGATNLVTGDSNGVDDVFVHDMFTGTTTRISVASNGAQANDTSRRRISLSANGRYIVFQSGATNLVPGDTNGEDDVFVHDTQTGATARISVDSNGIQGNNASAYPSISGDGRFVVFDSAASNLVSGDSNEIVDIFIYDVQTAITMRVSVDSNGAQGNGDSLFPSVSADGRYITFQSAATNLVPDDTNNVYDAFVYDTQSGTTTRVSNASNGSQANDFLNGPTISADGEFIAFFSAATNLVSGDTNAKWDVFVHRQEVLPVPTPQIRYVKWNATGINNGTSWTDAYTDLQSALAVASNGDEIWVAAGTYKPTTSSDRNISFTLKNGVAIYGGFAGNESLLTERDPATNITVLSGDIGVVDDKSDNSYHVMVASSVDNNTILDGFTITAGNANGVSPYDAGGGMYSDKGSLKLNDILFTDNYAVLRGGGLYSFYTDGEGQAVDLDLTGVIFSNNTTGGEGGGMATRFFPTFPLPSGTFSVSLTNVTFTNNAAGRTGGGMINNGSSLTLMDVTFSGNTALGGGGLSNLPYDKPSTLTNVTFSNNSADEAGGGMLIGSDGGTLTTLTNVTFDHNSTAINGGGIANTGYSELTLTNVTFRDNTADANGGGIFNGGYGFVESGGTIDLINTTFSSNVSNSTGSTIYNESGNVTVHNSILYGDSGKEVYGTASVTYSIVQGGYAGTGNLDTDPLLGSLKDNGGFTQTMALLPGSPAINAGNDVNCPATDQRGVARPQGSHCDIGAYEFVPNVRLTFTVTKTADTNDGVCNSDCSLREAIGAALEGDTVDFDSSLAGQTILLTSTLTINKDLIIDGSSLSSKLDINGNNSVRMFFVNSGVTFTIKSLALKNGNSTTNGGGIYNGGTLIVTDSIFSSNSAINSPYVVGLGEGGAVYNDGSLTVTNSIFNDNAASRGGAISCNGINKTLTITNTTYLSNNALSDAGGDGGAIYDLCNSMIVNSTFSRNTAAHYGGAILTDNDINSIEVTNSTFYNNTALNAGGIANYGGLIVTNSTFSDNNASLGGAIRNGIGGNLSLRNSILANSHGSVDCIKSDGAPEIEGINNLIESTGIDFESCGTPLITDDPLLGSLQANGGFTQTMALLPGSPAINAGNDANCPATDQRGEARPFGNHCDIGAYEYQGNNGPDTTGVFRPSNGLLYLKNSNTTGFADIAINYGIASDYPVVGDWDGNGTATIGVYRNGSFYLRNSNTVGFADWVFPFGQVGDQPIAGDWNGDGIDTIGIFRPSTGLFMLRNSNDAGPADAGSFFMGNPGDVGIAGDWTGKGYDTVGVFRPSNGIIFLKNTNETGFADIALNYGIPGDRPVTGDWNDDGKDTIGVYRNGQFMLRNSNDVGFAEIVFSLGNPGDMPIAGNWDGLP